MIPLKDENPTRSRALVTLLLIAVCCGIYFFIQPSNDISLLSNQEGADVLEETKFTFQTAAIPCEVVKGRPLTEEEVRATLEAGDGSSCESRPFTEPVFPGKNVYLAVLTSMFLHGGLLHLAGNMLFLWVFGNNIEDRRGKVQYLIFYLLAGLAATLAHIAVDPNSTVPVVGASGAIAGVMGAYLVLFPNARIRTLFFLGFFFFLRDISAKWLLGFWLLSQFFISPDAGVAWVAHVGGFVFGAAAGLLWRATSQRSYQLT